MSGSEASNLGYSEYLPNSNINGAFVNVNNTNNPANFGSNEVPPTGLGGASCNMDVSRWNRSWYMYEWWREKKIIKNENYEIHENHEIIKAKN